MGRLDGKVAIITGGSGGIGAAAARLFVAEGSKVLLADINESVLKDLTGELGSENADYIVADVTSPEDNQAMVKKAVERFGKVNVFLANAGIEGTVKPLHEYPLETFDRVLAINVRGVFLGLQSVIPAMLQAGGGSIVITSSVAGVVGSPGFSAYVTSKHAVIGMMRSAALEYGSMGIRVNTINPGPIETRMMRSIEEMAAPGAGQQVKAGFEAQVPLKRYGLPDEVARLMLFLASDESSYTNGSVYVIDGGFTAA
ncbi:dehydrogenase [Bellilinea caldifistulae]|uniref:Oxidoreductase n=1 Tax=Bellilinea caldifistulae TaxID=360411 RepID=A0A0P6XAM8_9CHLR|nr:SDR family oxidoreductase [Bellilinea caldifistulae]KPL76816.1 oxidoreductase [Bellilinea caldifistulae]GAP09033.1 dehydrogenase [Bellilinea caldifistulae]